ncbi:MAG: glucose-1-phosphate adenylyltransferase [Acidobacteria bacterium]|jgi:glucose-1-phosphate adenylyltransferase|nr:glucose-1-phosphate adenylyltransferase [Acidobacteriota bacterium]
MKDVVAVLLAGGAGERLYPLTRERAKPAVPFGGCYRIIDVTLSNCINSGVRRMLILTQYKALSLNRHIREGWNILSPELGEFIEILPPTKRVSEHWYRGTADALYQNLHSITVEAPGYVLVLAGDHIYKMNYALMLNQHVQTGADITVATIQEKPAESYRFGVADIDSQGLIVGFEEKPAVAGQRSPYNPNTISVSMGIYLFSTKALLELLCRDAEDPNSSHDFGKDIIPRTLDQYRVFSFDFIDENRKELYWRDVGTLEAYYEANMDLVAVEPVFNLYDQHWPIRTYQRQYPPAKFVFAQEGRRMGIAVDSIVSPGCIVSGGRVVNSVLSHAVRINSYSEVDSAIIFSGVNVGRYSRIRRAIIERDVDIPENSEVGFDPDEDRTRGYHVTESGLVVIGRDDQATEQHRGLSYAAS